MDDCFLNHLLVVTEHSAAAKKHDRTGAFVPRSKMNAMIARHISESLLEYEQEIFAANTQVGSTGERKVWKSCGIEHDIEHDRWPYTSDCT